MRKRLTYLMVWGFLSCAYFASAATPLKKIAEITSEEVQYINDGKEKKLKDSYCETFLFDKNGNEIHYNRYYDSTKKRQYTTINRAFDENGRLIRDSERFDINEYEYNTEGKLVKKTTYGYGGAITAITEYTYDDNGLLKKEEKKNTKGEITGSFVYNKYNADGKVLEKVESTQENVEVDGKWQQLLIPSKTYIYCYDSNGLLANDSIRHYKRGITQYADYGYNEEGVLVVDSTYSYDDMRGGLSGQYKNLYVYDEDGLLTKRTQIGYYDDGDPSTRGFKNDKFYYTYLPAPVGADYTPVIKEIKDAEGLGTITITLTAPAQATGLKGYKVMVDDVIGETLLPVGTTLTVGGQINGDHRYRVIPVYENLPIANASDEATHTIHIECPPPSNVQVISYSRTMQSEWSVKVKWDAPEAAEGLTLKSYKLVYAVLTDGQPGIEKTFATVTSDKTSATSYVSDVAKVVIRVYAVYNEGTSTDAAEGTADLSDITKPLRAHAYDNIGELKNAGVAGPDDKEADIIGSEILVNGIIYKSEGVIDAIYVSDATGALKLTVNTDINTPANFNVGDKIKNLRGYLLDPENNKYYNFEYGGSTFVSDFNTVTPYSTYVSSLTSNYNFAKLISLENIELTIDKEKSTAEIKDGDNTIKLIDLTGTIYSEDYVLPEGPWSVIGFLDRKDGENVVILRSPEDIKGAPQTVFANLREMKLAGGSQDNYTVTGEMIVTGRVADLMSVSYYVQDETAGLKIMLGETGMVSFNVGDKIADLVGVYDENYGFFCEDARIVQEGGNEVTPEIKTISNIKTTYEMDEAKLVKVNKALFDFESEEMDGEIYPTGMPILVQDRDTITLYLSMEDLSFVALKGKEVSVVGFVSIEMKGSDEEGASLVLRSPQDLVEYVKPAPVEFANLKAMVEAGIPEDPETEYVVTGEVLVTGIGLNGKAIVQDETAAAPVGYGYGDAPFAVGDILTGLKGIYENDMIMDRLTYLDAHVASPGNEVNAELVTIAQLNGDKDKYKFRFVRFEGVTFTTETPGLTNLDTSSFNIAQGDDEVTFTYWFNEYDMKVPELANVNGFFMEDSFGGQYFVLRSKADLEYVDNISEINAMGNIYVVNGTIVAEGAQTIEVYDATGCKVLASDADQTSVQGLKGMYVAKAFYADGKVKVTKVMVK